MPAGDVRVDDVWDALGTVCDPEIPTLSIVDLGLVESVRCQGGRVEVDLLPTFTGCPALDVIREAVERAVGMIPHVQRVEVRYLLSPAWSSDRVTERGRAALQAFGIAPPRREGPAAARPAQNVACPYCGSTATVLESDFGPTRCRTIYYCRACRNPFEKMKEV